MARTVVDLRDDLIARARRVTGLKRKVDIVNAALEAFVDQHEAYQAVLRLRAGPLPGHERRGHGWTVPAADALIAATALAHGASLLTSDREHFTALAKVSKLRLAD